MLAMIYSISILMFFNFSSSMMIWILMEVNMILFILLIKVQGTKMMKEFYSEELLFYLMIQTMGSMIFLMGMSMHNTMYLENKMMVILSLILKMGLFPLEKWMYKMSKKMNKNSFIILITIQKIPMMLILTQMESTSTILLILSGMLAGSILITKSKNMKEMLISSSIYSTMWMILSLMKSLPMFSILYLKYSVASMMMLKTKNSKENKFKMINLIMASMFMLGLPPFEMFFMKTYILSNLEMMNKTIMSLTIWLSTFIATFGYFKFMKWNLMKKENINMMKEKNLKTKMLILLSFSTLILLFN